MTDPNHPERRPDESIEFEFGDIEYRSAGRATGGEQPDPAIERLLVDTFDHRAVRLGRGRPDLDGVLLRVRRRRRQRRTVAAIGSVVVIGGGIVGLTRLSDGIGDDDGSQLAGTALGVGANNGGEVWSCSGPLGTAPSGAQQFDTCVRGSTDAPTDPTVFVTTTILTRLDDAPPATAPPTTAAASPDVTIGGAGATATTVPGIDVREVVVVSPTEQQYTVTAGDSLFSIGRLFDIEIEVIATYNGWEEGADHLLLPGETVRIPPNARVPVGEGQGGVLIYTVQPGDNATQIARRFAVTLGELAQVNEWTDEQLDDIQAGDEIVIPSSSPVANP